MVFQPIPRSAIKGDGLKPIAILVQNVGPEIASLPYRPHLAGYRGAAENGIDRFRAAQKPNLFANDEVAPLDLAEPEAVRSKRDVQTHATTSGMATLERHGNSPG